MHIYVAPQNGFTLLLMVILRVKNNEFLLIEKMEKKNLEKNMLSF